MNATPGIYRGTLSFEQGFTRIPNTWLRDPRIGFRAKGLLAYLLSHEIGYTITLGQIERETNDGRHAIRSAMDELIEAGYLSKQRTHDERGYNAGLSWLLSDPNPKYENPKLENPTLENRPALEENLNKKKTNKEIYPQNEFGEAFISFWAAYPRKVQKLAAEKAFMKAAEKYGTEALVNGAIRLMQDPNLPPKEFIPYPATWLNAGGWESEPYPPRTLSAEEKAARAKEEREYRRALEEAAREEERKRRERERQEIEANRPQICQHNRVKVICVKCHPLKVPKS